ncbi:hypothetical protein B566_EDAN015240 [Ephemera danica]|nr:hypothetical protein B566_EDAN015240 [Ephemera danica]
MSIVPGSQAEPPTEDEDDDYYSSEIRIANRENIHALTAKPNPTDFTSLRNGLPKESICWRVFTKEEDALQCAEKCSAFGMVPFMYCHRNSNRKYYLVTHPLELWYRNQNRPLSHTLEIIDPNKPSKLHVQLQYDKTLNKNISSVPIPPVRYVYDEFVGTLFNRRGA